MRGFCSAFCLKAAKEEPGLLRLRVSYCRKDDGNTSDTPKLLSAKAANAAPTESALNRCLLEKPNLARVAVLHDILQHIGIFCALVCAGVPARLDRSLK